MLVAPAAGGGTGHVARLIGERCRAPLGQTIIIENVVGGGSTLANDRLPGRHLTVHNPDQSLGPLAAPSLFTNLRYDTKLR
jgi:tripartite-type tricarboxylate transporter receptor subunit TctC